MSAEKHLLLLDTDLSCVTSDVESSGSEDESILPEIFEKIKCTKYKDYICKYLSVFSMCTIKSCVVTKEFPKLNLSNFSVNGTELTCNYGFNTKDMILDICDKIMFKLVQIKSHMTCFFEIEMSDFSYEFKMSISGLEKRKNAAEEIYYCITIKSNDSKIHGPQVCIFYGCLYYDLENKSVMLRMTDKVRITLDMSKTQGLLCSSHFNRDVVFTKRYNQYQFRRRVAKKRHHSK